MKHRTMEGLVDVNPAAELLEPRNLSSRGHTHKLTESLNVNFGRTMCFYFYLSDQAFTIDVNVPFYLSEVNRT